MIERPQSPHGHCVIVELADDAAVATALAALPADERALAATLAPVRARELIAGRTALHAALAAIGGDAGAAVLADDRGAPRLPAGYTGSISHKGTRAAAVVAASAGATIGIDLERAQPPRMDIGRRVLTAREQAALAGLAHDVHGRAVTLRFAIKEAIYKAVDPWVRRYVGFTEVELEVGAAGEPCAIAVVDAERLPVVIEATWQEIAGHWLATARARPR